MNKIQKYFEYRQSLIDQYIKGDMTKSEYLERNLDAVLNLSDKPFKYLDNVDKCLFNYQYFNALAKQAKMQSQKLSGDEYRQLYMDKINYYYGKKDAATAKALKLLDFKGVKAYFIKVRSPYLKGKLFEIVIEDYNMILHSVNTMLLETLRRENVFDENIKISKIDNYINARY